MNDLVTDIQYKLQMINKAIERLAKNGQRKAQGRNELPHGAGQEDSCRARERHAGHHHGRHLPG